jgi:hypothetical protein
MAIGCLLLTALPAASQELAGVNVVLQQTLKARTEAETYAVQVKSRWRTSSMEYREARRLYDLAEGANAAWVSAVSFAILSDTVRDLAADPEYNATKKAAADNTSAFVRYVNALPMKMQNKATPLAIAAIFDLAKPLVSAIREGIGAYIDLQKGKAEVAKIAMDLRTQYADRFKREATWKKWPEISDK